MLKIFGNALKLGLGVWGALLLGNSAIATEVSTSNAIANTEDYSYPQANGGQEPTPDAIAIPEPSDITSIAVLSDPTVEKTLPETEAKATTVAESIEELEPINIDEPEASAMEQVTSVSQLDDVQPTDWAFQAMRSLVERYGCIAGYPDGSYRGNRALSRYEFAAGLNACLDKVNQLILATTGELASKEDLVTLQRLQTEFAPELATLSKRLDNLEASVSRVEAQRFSATTTLRGETLVSMSGVGGEDVNGDEIDSNIVVSNRVELNLDTSFSGTDLLRARLAASNTPDFAKVTGTNFARLSFTGDNNNDIQLSALFYRYPIGDQAVVYFGVVGIGHGDFTPTLNPYINNSLLGNISNFTGESQIFGLNGGRGFGLEYRFSRAVRLSLGYLAANTNEANTGLFSGPYGAIAQLSLYPTESLSLGLTYVHSYNLRTGKGSQNAENPFNGAAISTNAYGLEASYQVSPKFNISGWVGLLQDRAVSNPNKGSDATSFTWALTFALPDLGGLGNLAGFIIGVPPKVLENDVTGREDPDTSLHLEAFYRYQVTDNIAITPGFFVVTKPEHNANHDLIYVGTIRTSFVF